MPTLTIAAGADAAEAQAAWDWLQTVDTAFLACRGDHNFPKLRLAKGKLPKGITATRQQDRSYNITQVCPDCGVMRTFSTVPDGWLGTKHHYRYEWPDGYRVPKGAMTHITVADMKAEAWRRTVEELDAIAARAAGAVSPRFSEAAG